ncbi:hypothetical protein CMI40_01295 [Candidatus Pacearchaeota archaeon]|nr:hypothetical protein [Candidatus Pacearchaeota archaeon]
MYYGFDLGIIVAIFLVYYFLVFAINKRMITNHSEVIGKFFMIVLLYVGIMLIYFSFVGRPISPDEFKILSIYIFITGFMSIMISLPNLLKDFGFFKKVIFTRRRSEKRK